MVRYIDALDMAGPAVAKDRRVLAALGPRMMELAGARAAGAHPYFVPVEHMAHARAVLGRGPLLAPEVTVVLERDPTKARDLARRFAAGYLTLPNYTNNLRTLGFGDADLTQGGSDRLIDAVVCWGDLDTIATEVGSVLRSRSRPRLRPGHHHTKLLSPCGVPSAFTCPRGPVTRGAGVPWPTTAPTAARRCRLILTRGDRVRSRNDDARASTAGLHPAPRGPRGSLSVRSAGPSSQ